MRRFSIRTMMALIVVFAVGLAALRNANELWARAMFLVALDVVGIAVLGAILLRGPQRAWWTGFALFSGGYLLAVLSPVEPELPTTQVLGYVNAQVASPQSYPKPILWQKLVKMRQTPADLKRKSVEPADSDFNSDRKKLFGTVAELQQSQGSTDPAAVSPAYYASVPFQGANRWRAALPGAVNYNEFARVGHSLFALLSGSMGGMIALWFYARRERQEAKRLSIPLPQSERE
jgi:hypothetical protein